LSAPAGHDQSFRLGWAAWTAHDGGVSAAIVVLLVVVVLATFATGRGAARPAERGGRSGQERVGRKPLSPYWFLAVAVLGVVLLRFGVNALVVAGGMALAAVRGLLPLLRLWPLFEGFRQRTASGSGQSRPGGPEQGPARRPQRMTRQEALQVFGLEEGASREDVQREYRRLMRQVHPDLGGSSYLAAKINEAKDVLS
jgi:hypothetical protein